ncbi:ATP-dependent DNA ligase LigD phosphoesterase module /ATP-dependent DNA ligase LigD polymerase module [Devosia lucknowensis]|uniref:DNA ligase (ATP) n=1 Tax=Devosia lucknowensis TaxID=1096929 RepID=A0A1Y6GC77_9HYPH|nr:DNA ligase D [Devosia lucknowensis]SMQ85380.1 ATP-dependent DNA ligase LigD phosphoesterase module /ATP-dependent DNA ligase LigD polymerase module [Devosia lucknowensis]
MKTTPGDLLKDYKAKRNFAKTQEPAGAEPKSGSGRGSFVVQKHDATRLHYDFRLELDGVLKSWAVTKGPSNNPGDKRLAVRVEDHPLEYGGFEGTIPEGEYGGGTVMLWDRGTWEPIGDPHEGLESGDLKFRLFGERMKGEYVLVHMKGRDTKRRSGPDRENWLLIKHRDSYARDKDTLTTRFTRSVDTGRDLKQIAAGAEAQKKSKTQPDAVWHSDAEEAEKADQKTRIIESAKKGAAPAFRPVQLATLVDSVPAGDGWAFEMKYDGYRCLAAIKGQSVRLYTRNGLDWTEQFGALVEPLQKLKLGSAVIDGEICAFDAKGRTDFTTLKNVLSGGGRLEYFAFDLLELDGKDLAKRPLIERKAALEKLLGKSARQDPVQYSSHVTGHGQKVFEALCRDGHEGVIAKRLADPYRGDRTRSWLKIKCLKRQEFVIGGWSPSTKRRGFASLLLGVWEDGKLLYRGRVGTGFSQDVMLDLDARLKTLARKTNPFEAVPRERARGVHWVKPELVAEIAYTELTGDDILRHPSFLGLREDKPSKEVKMEKARPPDSGVSITDEEGEEVAERVGVRLTSPHRVVFPDQGVTKAQLVDYYSEVVEAMLPHVGNRPLSLVRCPQGRTKHCFFQKHDTGGFPDQLLSRAIAEKDGEKKDYFHVEDLAGLVAGTQMNVLEWHIWGSRFDDVEKPDRLVFDIDPDEALDFSAITSAAIDIRDRLADLGLKSFPMVSGGKGIHVIVPLKPQAEWPAAKTFCKDFAQAMADDEPDRFTANISKARRKGRLFIDYLRNERGSTAISPWSVRSRGGAPVAVPVEWDEVPGLKSANGFSLAAAAERAKDKTWSNYFRLRQVLK